MAPCWLAHSNGKKNHQEKPMKYKEKDAEQMCVPYTLP